MSFLKGLTATLLISLCIFTRDSGYLEGATSSTTTTDQDEDTIIIQSGNEFMITDKGREELSKLFKNDKARGKCSDAEKYHTEYPDNIPCEIYKYENVDDLIAHISTLNVNSDEFKKYEKLGYVDVVAPSSQMRHDLVVLNTSVSSGKIEDPITGLTIATCSGNYNLDAENSNTLDTKSSDLQDESLQGCAASADYNGACWVQYGGYVNSEYKVKICHIGTTGTSGTNMCVTLGPGKRKGDFYSSEIKSFGIDDIGYDGPFDNASNLCPDTTTAVNALGYAFISESTDSQYLDFFDYYDAVCRSLAEKQTPGTCASESNCYCDIECRENGFMPPGSSDVWKGASENEKNCFLCHKNHRAVEFYCKKVYDCIHRRTSKDGSDGNGRIYSDVAKFAMSRDADKRHKLAKLYGRGQYLCGYYNGIRCGCAKLQLNGGPRHMMRIARHDDRVDKTCNAADLIEHPECHLFQSTPYVRQFYNDVKQDEEHSESCSTGHKAEFGYKKRGTFLFPQLIVRVGDNERNVGIDYDTIVNSYAYDNTRNTDLNSKKPSAGGLLEKKDGNADYFYNYPIGTSSQFTGNNVDYRLPTTRNIIFSPFFPKIYSIAGKERIQVTADQCDLRDTGQVYYFMLRLEFNIRTGISSLVAYQVIPKHASTLMAERADGSILKFSMKKDDFLDALDPNEIKDDVDPNYTAARPFRDYANSYDWLEFVNIGGVERPPIKYGYAGDTITMNTPLYLKDESSSHSSTGTKQMDVKLYFAPLVLKDVNDAEFAKDSLLPTRFKNLTVVGVNASSTSGPANVNTNVNNTALLYMKRFTVDYSNECSILQNYAYDTTSMNFLKKPPENVYTCQNYVGNDKIACLTSFVMAKRCNAYINCAFSDNSLQDCYRNNPTPKLKIYGNEGDLYEYQKNKDFRSKAYICIIEGFEMADSLSKYSNTRLFGEFGDPVRDYTVRYTREKNSPFIGTPTIPFSFMGKEPKPVEKGQDQIEKKLIFTMIADYFMADTDQKKYDILIKHLKSTPMVDRTTRKQYHISNEYGGNFKINNEPVISSYFQECASGELDCRKKFEVAHRTLEETDGRLCVAAINMGDDQWELPPRDLGTDYDVYVPLRCEYVHYRGYGAGGAGLTSEDETHCFSKWTIGTLCITSIGHQKYIPRFDATGGGGAFIDGYIDTTKIPVFDGYLHVTTGPKTKMARYRRSRINDACQGGVIGWCHADGSGTSAALKGKDHALWIPLSGTHAYWNVGDENADDNNDDFWFRAHDAYNYRDASGATQRKNSSTIRKDERKGNTEIGITWYGDSSVLPPSQTSVNYDTQINNAKTNLGGLSGAFDDEGNLQMCEYYYLSLLFAIRREMANAGCSDEVLGSANITELEKNLWDLSSITDMSSLYGGDLTKYQNDQYCTPSTSNSLTKLQTQISNIQNIIDLINHASSDVRAELNSCCSGLASNLRTYKSDLENSERRKNSYSTLSFSNAMTNAKTYCSGISFTDTGGSSIDMNSVLTNLDTYYRGMRKTCNNLLNISSKIANTGKASTCGGGTSVSGTASTTRTNGCDGLNRLFFSGKIDSKYQCLLCNDASNCYSKICDEIKNVVGSYYSSWKSFICEDKTDSKCSTITTYLSTNYPGYGYEQYVCNEVKPTSNDHFCSEFKNQVRTKIEEHEVDNIFNAPDIIDGCQFKDKTSVAPESCSYESLYLCTNDDDFNNFFSGTCPCNKYSVDIAISSYVDEISKRNSDKLNEIDNNLNKLISAISAKSTSGTSTATTYFPLAFAGKGGSPIDCRIEGNLNCPYADKGKYYYVSSNIFSKKCWKPWKYTLEDYGKHVINNLDSTQGHASKHGAIGGGNPDIFYPYKGQDDSGIDRDLILSGNGSNFSIREDNTGGTGIADKYTYYSKLFKNNAKDNFTNFSNIMRTGQSLAVFATDDELNWAGNDTSKLNDLENQIRNFGDDKEKFKQYTEKYHVNNPTISSGGAFWHRKGSGAGGQGDTLLSVGDVNVKAVSAAHSSHGNEYLELDSSGHMQRADESYTGDVKKQCTVRCPPIYRKLKDANIILPSKNEVKVDLVCEYTGIPETDMEPDNSSTVYPKKCYIVSDVYDKEYGSLKGKILISTLNRCPIAKCKYGIWGTEALTGSIDDEKKKFDRKTMLCKPKASGYEAGITRTSLAYNYLFDKNIYSGMTYDGMKDEVLKSRLSSDNTDHEIATCADTDYDKYIYDKFDMIGTFGLNCANGFWNLPNDATTEINPLYDKPKNTSSSTNRVKVTSYRVEGVNFWDWVRSCSGEYPFPVDKFIKYEDGKTSVDGNIYRDELYTHNNTGMFSIEWLIKDHTYPLSDGTRTTGILNYDKYLKNNGFTDSAGNIKNGRHVLEIACPPLSSDYDFDEYYAGNAEWPSADENEDTVLATGCKVSKDTFYFQQTDSSGVPLTPRRSCLRNGIWGPIFNPCVKGCMSETDTYGTYWNMVNPDGSHNYTKTGNIATVNGKCSAKYLNSQVLPSGRATGGSLTRACNLTNGNWATPPSPSATSGCNESLKCLNGSTLASINAPYPRTLKQKSGDSYRTIVSQLSSNTNDIPGFTTVETGVYLEFETTKKTSSYIPGLESYNATGSFNAEITGPSNVGRVVDEYGNALIDNSATLTDFYVITVKNTSNIYAMQYMVPSISSQNEFLNINKWMKQMKDADSDYTGFWSYKCNMNSISSSIEYDTELPELQERYKHAHLKIYIPAIRSPSTPSDACLNVKRVAVFSPALATRLSEYSMCGSSIPSGEASIKFRMPTKLPADIYDGNPSCIFPYECSYVSSNDLFPVIVNNGIYNARLFDFVWTPKLEYNTSTTPHTYLFKNWINTTSSAPAYANCNGRYLGYIKHNTMKHVIYTQDPKSEELYFLSAFCYNGHIVGYHGVKGIFPQLASKTVPIGDPTKISTKDCFMNGFVDANSISFLYNDINRKYRNKYGSDILDNSLFSIHKNAYIAAMTAKFWMAYLLPVEEDTINHKNDQKTFKANYTNLTNPTVQYIRNEYLKGKDSYYYRVVPRRFEWITDFGAGYIDSPVSSEMTVLNENDPFCTGTECINEHSNNDRLNSFLLTNYSIGENTAAGCV